MIKQKPIFFAAALVLLLLLAMMPAAFADVIYPSPGSVQAGADLNHLVATVDYGKSVSVMEGTLPSGVEPAYEQGFEGLNIYLRGVPYLAGNYNCMFNIEGGSSLSCPLDVVPATPLLLRCSGDVICAPNEAVQLEVEAFTPDNGSLSYQWYFGPIGFGTPIGDSSPSLSVGTATAGTSYYYCVVTNTNNGFSSQLNTPVMSVTVENSISSVALYSPPNRTSYTAGDMLDTAGLQLILTYANGSTQLVSSGFNVSPTQLDQAGTQSIQVEYGGYVCSFEVSVQPHPESITGVGVLTLPFRTTYTVGETFDPAGLSLRAWTESMNYIDITSGFVCEPMYLGTAGQQDIIVRYGEFVASFPVTVAEPESITSIGVLTLPNKTRYDVGETLDTAGLTLRVWTLAGYRDVDSGFVCEPTYFSTLGEQEIHVSYEGFLCSFTVSVEAPEQPVSLSVETMPLKTSYSVGEYLDITGLVLKQISSRQNAQLIYSGFTCTPIQMVNVGRQMITVYYGELSTSFTVTVTDIQRPSANPAVPVAPTTVTPYPTTSPTAAPTAEPTAVPTTVPTAVPSATPTAVPTAVPTAIPTATPTAVPTPVTRSSTVNSHQTNLGRSLIGVIVITAVLALGVLGVYVFVMNQGGFMAAEKKLRDLFRKGRGGRHEK